MLQFFTIRKPFKINKRMDAEDADAAHRESSR